MVLNDEVAANILKDIDADPNITARKLAEKYGVNPQTMRHWLKHCGVDRSHLFHKKRSPSERQSIIDDFKADPTQSYTALAEKHNCCIRFATDCLKEAGLYQFRYCNATSTPNKTPDETVAALREDFINGMSKSAIAKKHHVNINTVSRYTSDLPKNPSNFWRGETPKLCKMWYRGLKEAAERKDAESIFTDKEFMASIDPKHVDYCDEKGYIDKYIQAIKDTEPRVTCIRCGTVARRGVAQVTWAYDQLRFIDEYGYPDYKEGYICPICYDNIKSDERYNDAEERKDGRSEQTLQFFEDIREGRV